METIISIRHQQIQLKTSYAYFTSQLEKKVNRLDPKYAKDVLSDPEALRAYLELLQGDTGLILFNIQLHGDLLNLFGKPRKAKQYVIGNPLTAIQMTYHNIGAVLYAPLRMLVYEHENKVAVVEYDLPSSLFGQFGIEAIDQVAKTLDSKLWNVITLCES